MGYKIKYQYMNLKRGHVWVWNFEVVGSGELGGMVIIKTHFTHKWNPKIIAKTVNIITR